MLMGSEGSPRVVVMTEKAQGENCGLSNDHLQFTHLLRTCRQGRPECVKVGGQERPGAAKHCCGGDLAEGEAVLGQGVMRYSFAKLFKRLSGRLYQHVEGLHCLLLELTAGGEALQHLRHNQEGALLLAGEWLRLCRFKELVRFRVNNGGTKKSQKKQIPETHRKSFFAVAFAILRHAVKQLEDLKELARHDAGRLHNELKERVDGLLQHGRRLGGLLGRLEGREARVDQHVGVHLQGGHGRGGRATQQGQQHLYDVPCVALAHALNSPHQENAAVLVATQEQVDVIHAFKVLRHQHLQRLQQAGALDHVKDV
mmetsp:Transcript_27115/g.68093  ORF Transcript_27115/g.68093 Transcript_27115/m.68093 type:complete len:313 (+) Transcript_27115:123-1061(+)